MYYSKKHKQPYPSVFYLFSEYPKRHHGKLEKQSGKKKLLEGVHYIIAVYIAVYPCNEAPYKAYNIYNAGYDKYTLFLLCHSQAPSI